MEESEIRDALSALGGGSAFSVAMAAQFITRFKDAPERVSSVLRWLKAAQSPGSTLASPPGEVWQRGCPELIPGLSAIPLWVNPDATSPVPKSALESDPSGFKMMQAGLDAAQERRQTLRTAIAILEDRAHDILEELLNLQGLRMFQHYRAADFTAEPSVGGGAPVDATSRQSHMQSDGVSSGDWNVLYLCLHNVDCSAAREACPVTTAALNALPRPYGHALFSALAPGTHVRTHTGPTNKKLRIQLPLLVPTSPTSSSTCCRLRVGPVVTGLRAGAALLFDDSFQHEAWNESTDQARIVLIADVWHPDLTDEEVKVLDFIRKGQLRVARALSSAGVVPERADFYKVIQAEGDRKTEDEAVFGGFQPVLGPVHVRDD